MSLIDDIKRDREAGTPGPWSGHNMVHADRGDQMTPEEVGEYVANSVRMGESSRFLFVSGKHEDGGCCDVCHTGNGPRGPANTRRIARVPDMEAALLAAVELADASDEYMQADGLTFIRMHNALTAFRKAIGEIK